MQVCDIQTDGQWREKTVHGSPAFPCAAYDERFSAFIGHEVPWHWHEEVEFVYVREGSMRLLTAGQERSFEKGEGFFINTNVLCSLENQDHCQIDSHFKPVCRRRPSSI